MLEKEKEKVIRYCKQMLGDGLVKGTGGNISIYNKKHDCFAISPSAMDYDDLKLEDIVVMDLDGNIVEGDRKPSSEYPLHLLIYKNKENIGAVVHVHSTYLTTLATLRESLPASSYLIAQVGNEIRCADYATFGTKELAEKAVEAMGEDQAVLLANHGAVVCAETIDKAYNSTQELEECAKVYIIARSVGSPVLIGEEDMNKVRKKFESDYKQNIENEQA